MLYTYSEMNNDVIIALATPPLKSALALIRLSGNGVFELTDKLFSKRISGLKERRIFYGSLVFNGKTIDMVEMFAYPGPNTVTGEDVVEISCHGSMLITNEIIESYLALGARYATNGEFTSRAFLNGKVDLIEAEAVNDLINATTIESKTLSLYSLKGETSKLVEPIKTKIADLLSLIEVNIDYPEYTDFEEVNREKIIASINTVKRIIASLIEEGEKAKIIKDGLTVAIVGAPNAGKSSLLNAFLKEDKAIVSSIPGTTRDVVEGDTNLDGIPIHFLDTAGIRSSNNEIEEKGIKKSLNSIAKADLIIYVIDAAKPAYFDEKTLLEMKDKKVIEVYNKDDLLVDKNKHQLHISALNGDIDLLKKEIKKTLGIETSSNVSKARLCTTRQIGSLKAISTYLDKAKEDALLNAPIDIISVNLHSAYNEARLLLGEGASLDLTNEIFSRFCVGK